MADAIVRVFIENGDRTNRNKARLKYVLDALGVREIPDGGRGQARAGRSPASRRTSSRRGPRPTASRISACIAQKQDGLNWIGVVLPVGKLTADQMREIAAIARECGDGDIRLTVWQNFLFSGVADARVAEVEATRRGARTDDRGDRASAPVSSPAPATAAASSRPPTPRATRSSSPTTSRRGSSLDVPVNIHLTGCHNSCAQHYIGDIGLIGAKVAGRRGRRYRRGLRHRRRRRLRRAGQDRPRAVEGRQGRGLPGAASRRLLRAYLAHRRGPEESFQAFADRHELDALRAPRGARRPSREAAA